MIFRDDEVNVQEKVGVGSYFYHNGRNEVYILAEVQDCELSMICLNDGLRWDEPVPVDNTEWITNAEFREITDGIFAGLTMIKAADVKNYL